MRAASPELEAFIKETIKRAAAAGYHPTVFMGMRDRHGTLQAMKLLMREGAIQSGFSRLIELGLRDWSVESGIIRFRDEFSREEIASAEWRLAQAMKDAT